MQWVFASIGLLFLLLATYFGLNVTYSFSNNFTIIGVGLATCGFGVGGGLCLLAAAVAHRSSERGVIQWQEVRIADQAARIEQLERERQAHAVHYPEASGEAPST